MLLSEAKKILNTYGYLMESTKDLVGKFWAKRKEGSSITPEEADTLLNAPDFSEVVNPKYQEFIKATLKRIIGGTYTPKKPTNDNEIKPFVNVKETGGYKLFGIEFKKPWIRRGYKSDMKEYAENVYENYKNALKAQEILKQHKFDKETIDAIEWLPRYTEDIEYNISELKFFCDKEKLVNEDEFQTFLDRLNSYKLNNDEIFAYFKFVENFINEQGLENVEIYNKKSLKCSIYADYKGFKFYFNVNEMKFEISYGSNKEKTQQILLVNTGKCNEQWKYYIPISQENIKTVMDVIDTYGENYIEEEKERARKYKEWYDSLDDMTRDMIDYNQSHPNGNWCGD